jgi:dTDP-4-dehydrorhamnose 3,5-epimerase
MLDAGMDIDFVQDNHSRSGAGVLRGIHYQLPNPQGKLIRSVRGAIWDVAVDLRRSSPTFLEWVGVQLDDESQNQLWIPPGFGHGFVVLGAIADVAYKTTTYFDADSDRAIRHDDPAIGVEWPAMDFIVSEKDSAAPAVADAALYH